MLTGRRPPAERHGTVRRSGGLSAGHDRSSPEEFTMAVGPDYDERCRPVRLAVTLVIASCLTVTGACAGPLTPSPDTLPPAAGAPTPATTPPDGTSTPSAAPGTSAPPTSAPPTSPAPAPAEQVLRLGASGPAVRELQQRLSDLGFWLGEIDGNYGQLTRQAVMALQKAEGLTRDGVTGPQTRRQVPTASRPTPRTAEGDHIEIDLERQLLLVVRGGQVQWVFNTSTGNGEAYDRPSGGTGVARTPRGEFEVERQINGVRNAELGVLYRPKYFRGGIAVHGSGSIPAQPASHGCVRVSNAAMDLLWASDVAPIGTPVHVY
jgi:peptidoglycan hydrolase-like protein with peptidoglycan-binding domain